MEEFKHLPWPVLDVGTNVREMYTLNMPEYRANNPTDVFFCNLLELDPYHLQNLDGTTHSSNETESTSAEVVPRKFLDPRTGIEIPTHLCNHRNVNFQKRNIFLNKHIAVSSLTKSQHIACLKAMQANESTSDETTEEQNYRMQYESSASDRLQEKQLFLDKLRANYSAELTYRFHDVPPSINYFITRKWKKQLIEMHRRLANARYCMRTGISLLPSQCAIKIDYLHQEHLGNVPAMTKKHIEYLRQSHPKLMKSYSQQKITQLLPVVATKLNELTHEHGIDFVIPISTLKLILNIRSKCDWLFCMTVRESARSTPFHPKKEIVFEKPLPPMRLRGNERFHKGAKYLVYSCLNQFHTENAIETEAEEPEVQPTTSDIVKDSIEYKIYSNDEFIERYPKSECCYENRTFSIIEMSGCDDIEDDEGAFKILVPSKHATSKRSEENGEIQFVNFSPKIEFQAEYGGEVMTKDELLEEWCNLFFRPNACTERVRFDSVSGKIIHRQTISLMQVQCELENRFGIEVQHLLQRLWNVLCTLNAFPTGEYLLQRDKKQSDRVKVYEKTKNDSTSGIAISEIFKDVSFELGVFDKTDWYPIDENVVTELHHELQILPCAFPHAEYLRENYVRYPIEQQAKANKPIQTPAEFRKICPEDDSYMLEKKIEIGKLKKAEQTSKKGKRISEARYLKKAKRRAERSKAQKARKMESMEFESTKKLLIDTMDQYNTVAGQTLNASLGKSAPLNGNSIAARTRNRTKTNTPEKIIRSNRIRTPNKTNSPKSDR